MQNAEGHLDLRRGKYSRRILLFRSTLLVARKADKSPRDLHSRLPSTWALVSSTLQRHMRYPMKLGKFRACAARESQIADFPA